MKKEKAKEKVRNPKFKITRIKIEKDTYVREDNARKKEREKEENTQE